MDKLLPVINKLQNEVFSVLGDEADLIDLPQIVVVGSQSCGKSSLLESIVGYQFLPRGVGIVTRRPLIVQLLNDMSVEQLSAEFLHKPNTTFTDVNLIRKEINAETDRLLDPKSRAISKIPIVLKMRSKTFIDLTLVDLPGLTKIPVGDQPADIEKQIFDIVHSFAANPNALILAVTAGNTDIATSESLKIARSLDKDGDRTISVITKVDLMDHNAHSHNLLCGKFVTVKLGTVGVKCQSQLDIESNKTLAATLKEERAFFENFFPAISNRHGVLFLRSLLNKLLYSHIVRSLPAMRKKLGEMLKQFERLSNSLGIPVNDQNSTTLLLNILTKFSAAFVAILNGQHNNSMLNLTSTGSRTTTDLMFTEELFGGARIYYIFHEVYCKTVESLDPLEDLTRENILTVIRNSMGTKPSLFVPEVAFESLVQRQIIKLQQPSTKCVDLVYDELIRIIKNAVDSTEGLQRFPMLHDKLCEVAGEVLQENYTPTISMVNNLINMEMAYINTVHPDFNALGNLVENNLHIDKSNNFNKGKPGVLASAENTIERNLKKTRHTLDPRTFFFGNQQNSANNQQPNSTNNQQNQNKKEDKEFVNVRMIEVLIESYMELVKKKFQDSIPKAVTCFLINKSTSMMHSRMVERLYSVERAAELLKENELTEGKRDNAYKMVNTLKKALMVISEVKDLGISVDAI